MAKLILITSRSNISWGNTALDRNDNSGPSDRRGKGMEQSNILGVEFFETQNKNLSKMKG